MQIEMKRLDRGFLLYRITTDHISVDIFNLGATIGDIKQFNSSYKSESVVMRLPKYLDYFDNQMYFGSTVGSYAGRIAGSKFSYQDSNYVLPANSDGNFLHGGKNGLHTKFFDSRVLLAAPEKVVISFTTTLSEDDDSLPGELAVEVLYTISPASIKITFTSQSTHDRLANITNHTYWNLSGDLRRQIFPMSVQASASSVWMNNDKHVPAQKLDVKGVLDWSKPTSFREIFADRDNSLSIREKGLDNFIEIPDGKIVLSHRSSGRSVTITSTYPGCVIYTQNEKLKRPLFNWPRGTKNLGVAIEFQYPPNDVNTSHPMSFLKAGEKRVEEVTFSFHTALRRSVLRMIYGKNFK